MVEKVKLEIDFQDVNVPFYIDFENLENGPAALYGINTKSFGKHIIATYGRIMDRNGFTIHYLPKLSAGEYKEITKKLDGLPKNSLTWLCGKYRQSTFFVQNCGTQKDFPYPEVLERLTTEFKSYLNPDIFEYVRETPEGVDFNVKGKVRIERLGDKQSSTSLMDVNNNKVGHIVDYEEKFVPFDGKLIRFRAFVTKKSLKQKVKELYPVFSNFDFLKREL